MEDVGAITILTSPDGKTVYAVDTTEQASVLRSQLGPTFGAEPWIIGQATCPRLAWRTTVCVAIAATDKGMKRASDFYEPVELPLVHEQTLAQLDGGAKTVHGWSSTRPQVNQCDGIGVVQWLHVWALDGADAEKAARRIAKARERELIELYAPRMGVVGIDVSDEARELADQPVLPW